MNFSVTEVLEWVGGRLANSDLLQKKAEVIRVSRPETLGNSQSDSIAYFFSKDYAHELATARPGILVTGEAFWPHIKKSGIPLLSESAVVVCENPYYAMALLSEKMARAQGKEHLDPGLESDIHSSACVDSTAELGEGVRVGPNVTIGAGAQIGKNSIIYPGCTIGERTKIGESCVVYPNVTIYPESVLGSQVRLHAGVVIGADGFGYAQTKTANGVEHHKIYHFGKVVIGDDVEVGANSCIDRGTMDDTIIGNHVKIDNQVQIGHNCKIGDGTIVCGGCGLAGGSVIGKYVVVAGMVGIANKPKIGDGAQLGAFSLITRDVPAGGTGVGNPQRDHKTHFRVHAYLNKAVKK